MSSADSPSSDVNRLFTNNWGRQRSHSTRSRSPDPHLRHMFSQRSEMVSPDINLRHMYGSQRATARSPDPSMRHMFSERRPTVSPDRSLRHLYGGQRSQPQVSPDSSLRHLYGRSQPSTGYTANLRPLFQSPPSLGAQAMAGPSGSGAQAMAGPSGSAPTQRLLPGLDAEDYKAIQKRCTLDKQIGFGRFGTVYRGALKSNGRPVAIKVAKAGAGGVSNSQLKTEATIWKRLQTSGDHPNIPHVVTTGVTPDWRMYVITEYSPVGDLYSYMQTPNAQGVKVWQRLDENESRHMAINIARGVHYLHDLGVAHGDIKPENILLFPNPAVVGTGGQPDEWRYDQNVPKLCDFGNSRCRRPTDPADRIMFNVHTGTVLYTGPETHTGAQYDMCSGDVYSVGCVLVAMLLGATPFPTPDQALAMAVRRAFVVKMKLDRGYLANLIGTMARELRPLLIGTLEPDPAVRYTLAQFMADQWFTRPAARVYEDTRPARPYKFPTGDRFGNRSSEW